MFDPESESTSNPQPWPPCDRAQADGVPCQELDRDCEKCAQAYPEWQPRTERADANNKANADHPMRRRRAL